MPSDYNHMLYAIIPIALRRVAGEAAERIMPDRDEIRMFDSIRLSETGEEPATHLMTICPCTLKQATIWYEIMLDEVAKPAHFSNDKPDPRDKLSLTDIKVNPKFICIITDRVNGNRLKEKKSVQVVTSKFNTVKEVNDPMAIASRVNLIRIISSEEEENGKHSISRQLK
jgi:hypothetical protein